MRHMDPKRPPMGSVRWEVEWVPKAPPDMPGTDDSDFDRCEYRYRYFKTETAALRFAEKQSSFFGSGSVTKQTYELDPVCVDDDSDDFTWDLPEWINSEPVEVEMPWKG